MNNFSKKVVSVLLTIAVSGGLAFLQLKPAIALDFPAPNPPAETVAQPAKTTQHEQNKTPVVGQHQKPSEGKIVLGKFFTAMLWVVGSCAILFLILLLFRKRIGGMNMSVQRPMSKEQDLNSPSTVDEAVKLFIEKF